MEQAGAAPAAAAQPAAQLLTLLPPACQPWQRPGAAWCSAPASRYGSGLLECWGEDVPLEEAVRALGIHLTDSDLACLRYGLGDGHAGGSTLAESVTPA